MSFDPPEAISYQIQPGKVYENGEIGHVEKEIVDYNQVIPRARTDCVAMF